MGALGLNPPGPRGHDAVDTEVQVAAAAESARLAGIARDQAIAAAAASAAGGFFFDPITRTRYKYVESDGEFTPAIAPQIFIDPEGGNDAWDGSCGYRRGATTQGPKKTRPGVEAHAAFLAHVATGVGVTIAIRASDLPWRDSFDYYAPTARNGNRQLGRVSLCVYGGPMRKITALDVVPKGTITAHATIAGAYEFTYTHELYAFGVTDSRVFEDGEPLQRKQNEADCAAAGAFWYNTHPAIGVPLRVVFKPWTATNPISNNKVYEVIQRDYCFAGQDGCFVEGIHAFANGSNNGPISLADDCVVQRSISEQGTKHNCVKGVGGHCNDFGMINCQDGNNFVTDALGNLFVMFSAKGANRSGELNRCFLVTDGSIYAHSDGGASVSSGVYSHDLDGGSDLITMRECVEKNTSGSSASESIRVTLIDHMNYGQSANNQGAWGSSGQIVTITRGLFLGASRLVSSANLTMRNVAVVANNFVPNYVAGTPNVRMDIQDCIFIGGSTLFDSLSMAGASVTFTGNLVTNCYTPYLFTGPTAGAIKLEFARNRYEFAFALPPANNGSMATVNGVQYQTFAAWQALGYDLNSQAVPVTDLTAWMNDTRPSLANLDLRLKPTHPAYNLRTVQIDQAKIAEYLARPTTRNDIVSHIKNVVPATPVWDGMV
jgi:hypothetical protein